MRVQFIDPVNAEKGAKFGQKGPHWASGYHTGLDYRCPIDTAVIASASGTIKLTPGHPAYGIYIDIDHGNGIVTRYAHLSRKVKLAGAVRQGEVIAYSGNTGNVTGPHLHFEVIVNGKAQDPEKYIGRNAPDFQVPENRVPVGRNPGGDFSNVSDPNTWYRIAMFVGGAGLAGVGGFIVVRRL